MREPPPNDRRSDGTHVSLGTAANVGGAFNIGGAVNVGGAAANSAGSGDGGDVAGDGDDVVRLGPRRIPEWRTAASRTAVVRLKTISETFRPPFLSPSLVPSHFPYFTVLSFRPQK